MGAEEASSYESSEMLATFLASTPLLSDSWRVCGHANASAPRGFVVDRIGDVTYVAFSGVQALAGIDTGTNLGHGLDPYYSSCSNLVPLAVAADGIFPALRRQGDGDGEGEGAEEVMVHAGFLHLFLSMLNGPYFQSQMSEIMKKSKSIVFTGHSLGGTMASLSALWILSHLQSAPSSPSFSVLCITFGSPLLGNASLSRAILQERWGGNFCHVVLKHDIVPRLLLAPLEPLMATHVHSLLCSWHLSMSMTAKIWPSGRYFSVQLTEEAKTELFLFVLGCAEGLAKAGEDAAGRVGVGLFWPFGSYVFCTSQGAVCVDNAMAVVKLLYLMLAMASPSSSIEDHLKYEDYLGKVSLNFLNRREYFTGEEIPGSSYEAGLALALQSSEIPTHETNIFGPAKDCLKMAKRMGGTGTPNLNSARLAIGLSKVNPLRAQIEWYKATCDESDNQLGYYDAFKLRGASKRDFKVNMNRIKLAKFWNELIRLLDTNQLPHDFCRREKWVNASQFYKLLVEPLDIAEYYRRGLHCRRGHYSRHGRERRYEIFDRWWRERSRVDEEEVNNTRSKFASLTQDSCFWAKVEEAREWVDSVRSESNSRNVAILWENICRFEQYARGMVERKEVSRDVIAKNSSYSLWVEEWTVLKSQFQHFPPQFPGFLDGEVVP